MPLRPGPEEQIARLRADLRMGVPIVLRAARRSLLVLAAETLTGTRFRGFMPSVTNPTLAITDWRAETLRARAYDEDIARLFVPNDADSAWVHAIADPSADLSNPMKGPCRSLRGGDATAHRAAIRLCKQARLLPAALVGEIGDGKNFAKSYNLNALDLDVAGQELFQSSPLIEISTARLPMAVSGAGRVHVFRPLDGGDEHYAVEIGRPDRAKPVLSRLHSACFTGDLLGSLKCDCGPQLRAALRQIGKAGDGVLLYMNQEGRGIGLANKMRAYSLQDQGFDTVEANHRLGFEDDERDFQLGAEILRKLGFSSARLMTNNPKKVARMNSAGITVVERVPLVVGRNATNAGYLDTKAKKSGHLM